MQTDTIHGMKEAIMMLEAGATQLAAQAWGMRDGPVSVVVRSFQAHEYAKRAVDMATSALREAIES
jgi:hypothetical protein